VSAVTTEVLIDAASLRDEGSSLRGFGRYVRALLDSLPEEPGLSLRALASGPIDADPSVPLVEVRRRARGRAAWLEHVTRLGIDVARARPDVFHSPTVDPPLVCTRPWVQTLHDIIPVLSSDPIHARERRRWKVRALAVRRADRVIAITRHSADLGIRHLDLRPERVQVIHHGVNPGFGPPEVRRQPDPPFLLYVGAYGPDKGFGEAFQVIDRLAALGYPHRLRLVGAINEWARPFVERLHPGDRVDLLGAVSDEELTELYQTAAALVVTSRAEGFGRPPIEAMAAALPIVSFDNTSLPEVVGEGGVLVPDGDVPAFVAAVREILDDDRTWTDLSSRSQERAGAFSWERCAREHAELYREVAGR
jgi:glycosyltransferase involved in cell wall biosynthesis